MNQVSWYLSHNLYSYLLINYIFPFLIWGDSGDVVRDFLNRHGTDGQKKNKRDSCL